MSQNLPTESEVAGLVWQAVRRALVLAAPAPPPGAPETLFHSPQAEALKQEIVRTGRKLWTRAYVDGNGGNISARLSDRFVLCTPTLVSKGDLTPEDICLVDLDNALVCGDRSPTSEILLHLEIYKALPQAMAVVHCHPPYATAHAIAGVTPPQHLLPEQEVFVGPVAISPYHTPGTAEFARSVLPFVHKHRVILLANHGLVSWSDTVTHAEWAVEIIETYCKTAHLARQLNPAFSVIPPEKIADLLDVKRQLGIPDPRIPAPRIPDPPAAPGVRCVASSAQNPDHSSHPGPRTEPDLDRLVHSLTRQILEFASAHPGSSSGHGK